jgi:DUF2889 family protein
MAESTEPKYVGGSAEALTLADRWEELAATVAAEQPFFDRTFRTQIFRSEDESLSLTSLDDDFHEMRIALRVANDGTILEAAGRMNRHPYDTCPRAVESLAGLAGINVYQPRAPQDARASIPRTEGCLHLVDMLGVAIRSFRIARGHDIPHHGEEGRREFLRILPNVRDTCISFAVE